MGSYFHVIERKVGGNLDAFRRELGSYFTIFVGW